jgi:hypothetical protein
VLLEKLTFSQLVKNFPLYYRNRRFSTVFPILSQMNSDHALTSYFCNVYCNITSSSRPRFSKCSLSFGFLYQLRAFLGHGLDGSGFESRQWKEIFLSSSTSRPALWSTQPPIQWRPEFFPGGRAVGA